MPRAAPILHRDDPAKEPLVGHVKVTRADWLNMARATLISHGVAEVKIQPLARRLAVSRSSFYWYFDSRNDLLAALLDDWEDRNIDAVTKACAEPAATVTEALCHVFKCFVDPRLFDPGLDFAVREWARRDTGLRARIDRADATRLAALTALFERHAYPPAEADIRARIVYFQQLGYHALELNESLADRMSRLEGYLKGFTGQTPKPEEVAAFQAFAEGLA